MSSGGKLISGGGWWHHQLYNVLYTGLIFYKHTAASFSLISALSIACLASISRLLANNCACFVLIYCSLKAIRPNSSLTPAHLASNRSTDDSRLIWRSSSSSDSATGFSDWSSEVTWSVDESVRNCWCSEIQNNLINSF